MLVFLTGQHEIEFACKTLSELESHLDYKSDVAFHADVKVLISNVFV